MQGIRISIGNLQIRTKKKKKNESDNLIRSWYVIICYYLSCGATSNQLVSGNYQCPFPNVKILDLIYIKMVVLLRIQQLCLLHNNSGIVLLISSTPLKLKGVKRFVLMPHWDIICTYELCE